MYFVHDIGQELLAKSRCI